MSAPLGETVIDDSSGQRREHHWAKPISLKRREPGSAEPPSGEADQSVERRMSVRLVAAKEPVSIENRLSETEPPPRRFSRENVLLKPVVENLFAT